MKINYLPKRLIRVFSSVKLTVVLLITVAMVLVIGTVIPQNQDPQTYLNLYGQTLTKLLRAVQFTEIYHSYLFIGLLTLFSANTLVCSLKRLKYLKRLLFYPKIKVDKGFFTSLQKVDEFNVTVGELRDHVDQIRSYLVTRGYGVYSRSGEQSKTFLFQKGKWGRIGPELVHFSILIILLGGIISGIFGFSTQMSISEGGSQPIPRSSSSMKLTDFSVAYYQDKFSLSIYELVGREYRSRKKIVLHLGNQEKYKGLTLRITASNRTGDSTERKLSLEASWRGETKVVDIVENDQRIILPGNYAAIFRYFTKEYSSQIEIIDEAGKVTKRDTIQVNHPLKYGGINFYQQSYKEEVAEVHDADWVVLEAYSAPGSNNKLLWQKEVKIGQKIQVGKNLFVTPTRFFPHLVIDKEGEVKNRSWVPSNPAVYLQFSRSGSDNSGSNQLNRWIFKRFGDVHYGRVAKVDPQAPRFRLVDFGPVTKKGDISILKVASLPGLELIYGGFGLLIVGLVLSFYVFHKRIWILIDKKSGKLQVGGKCNKQVKSFNSEMEEIFKIVRNRGEKSYE